MSEQAPISHSTLVEAAALWLRKDCSIVTTELCTFGESPDAIGWNGSTSTLIECKASLADFKADKLKPFRFYEWQGIGMRRYYLSIPGVIKVEDLPPKWGLLELTGAKIRLVRKSELFEQVNHGQEIRILLSLLRRIGQNAPEGVSVRCYTIRTRNRSSLSVCVDEETELWQGSHT